MNEEVVQLRAEINILRGAVTGLIETVSKLQAQLTTYEGNAFQRQRNTEQDIYTLQNNVTDIRRNIKSLERDHATRIF